MNEPIAVRFARTEDVEAAARAAVIQVCVMAHNNEDFNNLFSFIPSGGGEPCGRHNPMA